MANDSETPYDLEFYWDPVCPFAWITSRWVEKVAEQRDYTVDWKFIALRLINKDKDYPTHFPPGYEHGHTAGLRMLRVAAAVRAAEGKQAMGPLYTAMGLSVHDVDRRDDHRAEGVPEREWLGTIEHVTETLAEAGLPTDYASAADDDSWDAEIDAEGEYALSLTGKDVGTPILAFEPPNGPAFFGPVISRVPDDKHAAELWDAVVTLATVPSFTEFKRSMRERPQLRSLGVDPNSEGIQEDWKSGRRGMD